MLFKTISASVFGIDAELVEVEIDLTPRSGDAVSETATPTTAHSSSTKRVRGASSSRRQRSCSMPLRPAPDEPLAEHRERVVALALGMIRAEGQ